MYGVLLDGRCSQARVSRSQVHHVVARAELYFIRPAANKGNRNVSDVVRDVIRRFLEAS